MVITWTDVELKKHTVDLSKAVTVEIGDMRVAIDHEGKLQVRADGQIYVHPEAANQISLSYKLH